MKILCVIDSLGPGGAQRQLVSLAQGLKSRGHDVQIFTYYSADHYRSALIESNISVQLFQKTSKYSIAPMLRLRRHIRDGRFDFVISFLDTPNLYAELANIGSTGTQLVVSKRSSYPKGSLSWKIRLVQEFHRLASMITVNSHHQRERMESEFDWMVKKIQTIYNGVSPDVFRPTPIRVRRPNALRLLAVSSVSFNKNSLNLAKAIVICKERYAMEVVVDWVGAQQVSGEGTRPKDETNSFLKKSGVSTQWTWHGVRSDISEMLASHDALVHPSYFESLPNAVCEALTCGRPVLASRVCDNPKLVQEGVSGFLFDPGSPDDIALAIRAYNAKTSAQRKGMSEAARKYAEEYLSYDRFIDEYEQLLERLLAGKTGASLSG